MERVIFIVIISLALYDITKVFLKTTLNTIKTFKIKVEKKN